MPEANRLRVLFIATWYAEPNNPFYGAFIKNHAMAASLHNDVVVIYNETPVPGEPSRLCCIASDKVEDGIRTIRTTFRRGGCRRLNNLLYVVVIYWAFRKLFEENWRPDVIHAHVYPAGVAAVIIGKVYRIPVVITEHQTLVATGQLKKRSERKLRLAMNRAKLVLPVSEDLATAVRRYGVTTRCKVVPNALDCNKFHVCRVKKHRRKEEPIRLLTVCNLVPRKCVDLLLKSLAKLREQRQDFVLDVVGDGPNREEYERLAQELGLEEVVIFHGRQPDVAGFMRACDFFVMPSSYENCGVVYLESLASGKPVIATNAGGPREFVSEGLGKLVSPHDLNGLADAIAYMLDNYQIYQPEKLSQYVKDRFDFSVIGRMLSNVYQNILAE